MYTCVNEWAHENSINSYMRSLQFSDIESKCPLSSCYSDLYKLAKHIVHSWESFHHVQYFKLELVI